MYFPCTIKQEKIASKSTYFTWQRTYIHGMIGQRFVKIKWTLILFAVAVIQLFFLGTLKVVRAV